jgi:hypothetical protein
MEMMKLSLLAILMTVLLVGGSAAAQDVERDLLEISIGGGLALPGSSISEWHNDSLGAGTGWSLNFDFGYFLRYNMVVGFNFAYTQFPVNADDEADGTFHRLYNPNLYLKYSFIGESNFEPYLRAQVGVENAKFTTLKKHPEYHYWATSYDPALSLGGGLGIFYYTSDYSGLFLEGNFHWAGTKDAKRVYDDETLIFGENLTDINIRAGIRVLVGSGE